MSNLIIQDEERYIPGIMSPPPHKTRQNFQHQHQHQLKREHPSPAQAQAQTPVDEDNDDDNPDHLAGPSSKRPRHSASNSITDTTTTTTTLAFRPTAIRTTSRSKVRLTSITSANDPPRPNDMSDGKNEARALRAVEIMNDFRTLQHHIASFVSRPESSPPDQASYALAGYAILRQCNAQGQALLAMQYDPGNLGLGESSRVSQTEHSKAELQRVILDSSARRFRAHKVYLTAAAAMRWVQSRQQVAASTTTAAKKIQALAIIDGRLRDEVTAITDEMIVNDLRAADGRKNYWLEEDPSLGRILAWIANKQR